MGTTIQLRRDTSTNWTSINPILAQGEIGYETDRNLFKISSNGITPWNNLPYFSAGSVPAGEINTSSNVGAGVGQVFKQKSGVDLQLRTLKAGANIVISNNTDDITISATSNISNIDNTFSIVNAASPTKQIAFSAASITAGQTRTITMPDANVTLYKDINTYTEKTTLADNDWFLIEDSEDSNNKKKVKKSAVGTELAQTILASQVFGG